MKKRFRKIAKITLVLVYLVIIAGAVVRMTGSGMGCPDWPKCFGYYIPPTEVSQLEWQADRFFKKGQVIIVDNTLKVANEDFTTGDTYNESHWETYTKHDYAIFNPTHTWTEYINRLFGALAGFATFIMAIASLYYRKEDIWVPILSWLAVIGMGFQAWLGATVVYSVLAPARITIHMLMAFVIVAVLLVIIYRTREHPPITKPNKTFKNLLIFAVLLTTVQVIFGTQVRQFVDEQIDLLGDTAKNLWLAKPELSFYIHRSISSLVFLTNAWILYLNVKNNLGFEKVRWVFYIIVLEIASGMAMYYFDFPFTTQTIHLVLATLLFGVQFYLILETGRRFNKTKTL
ncbi:cytochrome oxidase assembly [Galbibacter marinus]|uniref:Cytochrome oxidase assembly n=1 Tax=Galbibacter marinus TaxID=555500 RepID=K2PY36_9FLAO|nr:COX15/CtaA family protein [Galbibacter marinus]EKF56319.1 cytochrome oxidase assembly [Galbibacter marinus]